MSAKYVAEATTAEATRIRREAGAAKRELTDAESGAVQALESLAAYLTGRESVSESESFGPVRFSLSVCHQEALSRARSINESNGELSESQQGAFDALIGAAKSLNANVRNGDMSAAATIPLSKLPPSARARMGGAKYQLLDERGNCIRSIGADESFEDVVREQAPHRVSDTPTGEDWVRDGLELGGFVRAMGTGPRTSAEVAALGESGAPSGGYSVPSILGAQFIDRMRPRQVMNRGGQQVVPLTTDETKFVKIVTDPTAMWRRENTEFTESEPTFGAIVMRPKMVGAWIVVSRELLEDGRNVSTMIERAITGAMATELDRAGMFGEGTKEPVGIVNEPGISGVVSVGAPDYDDVLRGYRLLLDNNAQPPTALIMANREWETYASLSDSTGQPLRRPEAIADLPFLHTSAVPTDEGAGSDESTMIMGDFTDSVMGIRTDMRIEVLRELQAKSHQYVFVAHMRVDRHVYHPESFCKFTGVTSPA